MKALNDFENLVFEMRNKQNAYFKTRRQEHLTASKQLERQVDKALMQKIEDYQQPPLFPKIR